VIARADLLKQEIDAKVTESTSEGVDESYTL
jgi:hypothetical protein